MGQAPATDKISLRTVPRNFPGRSGTREDKVCLVSPETAAASALTGVITDPRDLEMPYPRVREPEQPVLNTEMLVPPVPQEEARRVEVVKGPNVTAIPDLEPIADAVELPVLLKVGDNISTDEILPAGTRVLPYRSNIPAISRFTFEQVDPGYAERAKARQNGGHVLVGGNNYGQGSSREHAALAPRYLGLRVAIAKDFARIHRQNLINFGVLPLTFDDPADYDRLEQDDVLEISDLHHKLHESVLTITNRTQNRTLNARLDLTEREIELIRAGGLLNWIRNRRNT
jgi:aconitate hydratase